MKITAIKVYKVDLPLLDGNYKWANGKSVGTPVATIVAMHTNLNGIIGYGEVVPLGPNYLPSYDEGVRTGLKELCPKLIGQDPTKIKVINDFMDFQLKGHPYVKSPLDMACWDILGKVSGLPLCTLLGGNYSNEVPLSRSISQGSAKEMAKYVETYKNKGYSRFQLKLGRDVLGDIARIQACQAVLSPGDILIGDANGEWLTHQALQVAKATEELHSFYLEQPCTSYEECLTIRKHSNVPLILDECVTDLKVIVRAWNDQAADVIDLKISKLGGISKAKEAVDFCSKMGLAMTVVDAWGSDMTTAAILHLASTVPQKLLFRTANFMSYNAINIGKLHSKEVQTEDGLKLRLPENAQGLGIEPDMAKLGDPIFVFE